MAVPKAVKNFLEVEIKNTIRNTARLLALHVRELVLERVATGVADQVV